jgi:hypothetical protein
MNLRSAACGSAIVFFLLAAGCMTPSTPGLPGTGIDGPVITVIPAVMQEETMSPSPPAQKNVGVNTSAIPLRLSDADWQAARSCGWSEKNFPESAALFTNSCTVKTLLRDGWTIRGMRYDLNLLGNRCRRSTHPNAPHDCDWCRDGGPVLVLGYRDIMETELMGHLNDKTVTHLGTTLPPDSGSISKDGSMSVVFHNGTILYTFRDC